MEFAGYEFDGPYLDAAEIDDQAGIYVVLTIFGQKVLDVGESGGVRGRLQAHDREDEWKQACPPDDCTCFLVMYTPGLNELQRMAIESEIRDRCHPACGKR